jgi:hypothetical protein
MIDLPESYEDSEKEANDDEMREYMTYTIESIKEMLSKMDDTAKKTKWIESEDFCPSDTGNYDDTYYGGESDGEIDTTRNLLPIIRQLVDEVERLEKDRNMHWDLNDRFDHENTKLKKELQHLQEENEELRKEAIDANDCATRRLETIKDWEAWATMKDNLVTSLQSQLAKYERSIKDVLQLLGTPTMSYCPTQEIQELADIRYKASKQLQEALKQL